MQQHDKFHQANLHAMARLPVFLREASGPLGPLVFSA